MFNYIHFQIAFNFILYLFSVQTFWNCFVFWNVSLILGKEAILLFLISGFILHVDFDIFLLFQINIFWREQSTQ